MTPLRILLTNITLAGRTGTETYVRDLALALARRGHQPLVYTTDPREIAREIEAAAVPVVDDLARLGAPPDVIHGHHFPETLTALLHFPCVPALGFCHDWGIWHDAPVRHPRLRRYVAVDDTCRDRLLDRHGVPAAQVRVVLNAVDLERFPPRGPLPEIPRRALVFSNNAADDTYLGAVRTACAAAGIALDVLGSRAGTATARPGDLLGRYDLVFAKARCALEAMAVGAAVVLCDVNGLGPLVSAAEFDRLRRLNFGRRTLREPLWPEKLAREIARYDAADAAQVAVQVRTNAALDSAVDELVALYREVIEEQRQAGPANAEAEARAAADGLRQLLPYYRELRGWQAKLADAEQRRTLLLGERDRLAAEAAALRHDVAGLRSDAAAARADVAAMQHAAEAVRAEAAAVHARRGELCDALATLRGELKESQVGHAAALRLLEEMQAAGAALRAEAAAVAADRDACQASHAAAEHALAASRQECERLTAALAAVHGSATLRLRNRLARTPLRHLARLARRALG